jgi:hypothetical protein
VARSSHILTEELPVNTTGCSGGGAASSAAANRRVSCTHSVDDTPSSAASLGAFLAQPAVSTVNARSTIVR